jgi:hypothetical protein
MTIPDPDPAQNRRPATQRERAGDFILTQASALGIKVGTNGTELAMVVPLSIPRASRRSFEEALQNFRAEVIAIVLREGRP